MKHLYIVTGTSSGIGKSIATNLLQQSENTVYGLSRNQTIFHENYIHIKIDLSNLDEIKAFKMPNIENYGMVSLINNAGILGEVTTLNSINIENIEKCIQVNYTSLMILSTLFIQAYQSASIQKTILNISSGAAKGAYASWANYCSSKAAVEMLTRCIQLEQESQLFPIECFAIAPGVVNTNMQKQIRETELEHFDMKPKFIELYETNKLYDPNAVALKIIDVTMHPNHYTEKIFRIEL